MSLSPVVCKASSVKVLQSSVRMEGRKGEERRAEEHGRECAT